MASLSHSSNYTIAYIFIKTPIICKLFSNIFVTFASHVQLLEGEGLKNNAKGIRRKDF
jgi:hypothetical protein